MYVLMRRKRCRGVGRRRHEELLLRLQLAMLGMTLDLHMLLARLLEVLLLLLLLLLLLMMLRQVLILRSRVMRLRPGDWSRCSSGRGRSRGKSDRPELFLLLGFCRR